MTERDTRAWIAARFFEKSVDDVLSPQDQNLSTLYGYLGRAFLELPGGAEQAIKYNRAALTGLSETSAGTPLEAGLLSNIGAALYDQGRYAEAQEYNERALTIDQKSYGPDHPDVARDLSNLARLLMATNRLQEAELLMRRALGIMEKSYGLDHPNVAMIHRTLEQLVRASGAPAHRGGAIRTGSQN